MFARGRIVMRPYKFHSTLVRDRRGGFHIRPRAFKERPYNPSPTSLALGHLSRRERLTGVFVRLCVSHDLNPTP